MCCNPADCNPLCFPPYAQVYLGCCPLPGPLPIRPEPVRPLAMPCPPPPPILTPKQRVDSRYDNFYNWYNQDYLNVEPLWQPPDYERARRQGIVVDGKSAACSDCVAIARRKKYKNDCERPGCPRGFKPCRMRLRPPNCCDPCSIWIAEIPPCPKRTRLKCCQI